MKKLFLLPLSLLFISGPAMADYRQGGGVEETACYETRYTEEYIPGTASRPGRVQSSTRRVRVPCSNSSSHSHAQPSNVDDNSCIEGSIIGGVLGGAAGGTLATQENWIWSIPAGIVGGAMVGCQVDGG